MSVMKFAALVAIGLSLAACAGNPDGSGPGPRENTGTLLGAGTGALLGAAVAGGGTGDRLAGAAHRRPARRPDRQPHRRLARR